MAEIEPKMFTELAMLLENGWVIKELKGWTPGEKRMEIRLVCERKQ